MMVQTRRGDRFATVLRGVFISVDGMADGHVPLLCRGAKRETGEAYEFRVLLTKAEIQKLLARAGERAMVASMSP